MSKIKNNRIMRLIFVSYVFMLLMCVFVGAITALMRCYSLYYGFLIFVLLAWSLFPLREIGDGARSHPDFSTVLFVLTFAVLVVIVVAVSLLMKMDKFWSIVCIVSSWVALLMTALFVLLIPKESNLKWWKHKRIIYKKLARVLVSTF